MSFKSIGIPVDPVEIQGVVPRAKRRGKPWIDNGEAGDVATAAEVQVDEAPLLLAQAPVTTDVSSGGSTAGQREVVDGTVRQESAASGKAAATGDLAGLDPTWLLAGGLGVAVLGRGAGGSAAKGEPPTVTITHDAAGTVNNDVVFTITFSSPVSNFTAEDIVISNGFKGTFSATSGTVYQIVVTPTASSVGEIALLVPASAANDASGNGNAASATVSVPFDTKAPGLEISDDVAGVASGEVTFTFAFNEPVTGFSAADVLVEGGVAGIFTARDNTVFTLVVTPLAESSGEIRVQVPVGAAVDLVGNPVSVAVQSGQVFDTVNPDRVSPTLTISDNIVGTANGEVTFTFAFSEPVFGFTADAITVANGSKGGFVASSSTVFSLVVVPAPDAAGTLTVDVAAGSASDAAGNGIPATQASQVFDTRGPDVQSPSVVITDNSEGLARGDVLFTFTFSEPVSGFSADDISVANGAKGGFVAQSSTVYTLLVTPPGSQEGSITVGVAAGVAVDLSSAANRNTAAVSVAQLFDTRLADTTLPTVVISDNVLGTANGSVVFTFVFSEPVSGFSADDIVVTGGVPGAFTPFSNTRFSLVVTPPADRAGSITVDVPAGAVTDTANNANPAAIQVVQPFDTLVADTVAPTVAIESSRFGTINSEVTFTFTFSEPVSGFTALDVLVGNATKGVFSALSSSVYTLAVTPVANASGNITVEVVGGAAEDAARNPSLASAPALQSFDTIGPSVSGIVVARSALYFGQTSQVTITFNEPVTGFGIDDLGLENGSLSSLGTVDGGITWTAVLTPAPNVLDATNVIVLAAHGVSDAVGNVNSGPGASNNYAVDTLPLPQIALSAIASGLGGFSVNGMCSGDVSAYSVAAIGDTNGDGLDDLLIGAPGADSAAGVDAGRAFVVFGKADTSIVDLSLVAAGIGGFAIDGAVGFGAVGSSVAGAGDVNGDGFGDMIVGAPLDGSGIGSNTGASYVIFGRTATTTIVLSALAAGNDGFAIAGHCGGDYSGFSVAGAGDVNGDGLADLLVGAYRSSPAGGQAAGRSYVVLGRTGPTDVSLSQIAAGIGGFVVNGHCIGDFSGESVAAAGDVNGDGIGDLLIGAGWANTSGGGGSGRSYVVFGGSGTTAVDLSAVADGSGGFSISGRHSSEHAGASVSAAGDVNGDGLGDVLIGAYRSNSGTSLSAGLGYVVFGKTGTTSVLLSAVASGIGGFAINGQCAYDESSFSVAVAGDVNGDGLSDLLIGAPSGDTVAGSNAGRSYVVFGRTVTEAVQLSNVEAGNGGFVINGQCAGDWSGRSVRAAGDVNGDGLADLIVGAPYGDPTAGVDGGRSYVIFGSLTGVFQRTAVDSLGGSGADVQTGTAGSETLVAGAGNDTVTGNGGADILYGGSGDDHFVLDADNLSRLAGGVFEGNYARVDGGTGSDTVRLAQGSGNLDLRQLAGQNAQGPGSASRLESIERLDLAGDTASNTLTLTERDVHDLTGINLINSGTQAGLGWSNGTRIFGAVESRHQLVVEGGANDGLVLTGSSWNNTGTATRDGSSYAVYESASGRAQVLVGAAVAVSVVDTQSPGVGIVVADNVLTMGETTVVTFMFSEPVSGFGNDDITVENGTLSAVVTADGGLTWTATLTPVAGTTDLTNAISVAAGAVIDATGNANVGVTRSNNYAVDTASLNLSAIAVGAGGFVIEGQAAGERSGWSVAGGSDINGDGLADLVLGAAWGTPGSRTASGRTYVIHGQTAAGTVALADVANGVGGFVVNGQDLYDYSGISVDAVGDINGDGLDDVLIGARAADGDAGTDSGRSYVVFGKTSADAVELSAVALGNGGFVVNGHCGGDRSGYGVSAVGDVNGDGLVDLLIGAGESDPAGQSSAGRSYVVFGKTSGAAVDLSAVAAGAGGFAINGQCADDGSGRSLAGAGDVNGDGLADLLIGAAGFDGPAGGASGRSYVVFGRTATALVELSAIAAGTGGLVIDGEGSGDSSGLGVAAAGDVNGDGLADLLVGASASSPAGGVAAGRSYLVFGRTAGGSVGLSVVAAGIGGFVINGQCAYDGSGISVAAAGDVNGDGLADLLVAAPAADPVAGSSAGRTYVVFGRTATAAVELSVIEAGSGGFAINGQSSGDLSGWSVAAAGDVNGDGLADLLLGAPYGDPAAQGNAGRSYVIFGSTAGVFQSTGVDTLGGSGADALNGTAAAETLVAGAGNDTVSGNGGADVLYGGAGDDVLVLNADNLARLAAAVTGGNLARVDGGSGLDTLRLEGAGLHLDLGLLADQGGALAGNASRLDAIEKIDLAGSGNNTLTLSYRDVIDLSGMNLFNNANGWIDGTYDLAAGGAGGINPERRHQLVVDGNAGDVVNAAGGWINAGTVGFGSNTYGVYQYGDFVQMLVDLDLTRNIV